jgi:hypothetical protein
MLTVKPSSTIRPAMELYEEIQYTVDVTSELDANTISAIDFNIFDSDDESVDDDFNGGVSHDAGIISFGIKATAKGKYKLEFIVTCNELLPDAATPYEFIFYMWVKVKDI